MSNKMLLLVAIVMGVIVAVLINRKFSELEARAEPPTTTFYRARVDIQSGTKVQEAAADGYLEQVTDIPMAFSRSFPEAIDSGEYGAFAREMTIQRPVSSGEFLMQRHLEPISDVEVLVAIPEGEIAFSFPVSTTGAVSYLVSAGDVVDIYRIAEVPTPEVPGGSTTKALKVAQDIKVFAVDTMVDVGEGVGGASRGRSFRTVTVTGPPSQIEQLMVDASKGPLQLVLKSRKRGS